jgi:glycosyltransferase involved in cell wall biosynthesis
MGKLLLVIPPVVRIVNGVHEVEGDFANNLRVYLDNFSHVTFACPVSLNTSYSGILKSIPLNEVNNSDRLTYIMLPYTYREDRHLWHYLATRKRLRSEIYKADYLLFSPHANYDWPTLAAKLAIRMKRKYDMESDWDHESVQRLNLSGIPFGFNKIRKTLWMRSFLRDVRNCFSHSSVALLQGQDVFDAYKDIAPNPQKVLNVQVSSEDCITLVALKEKLTRINERRPLTIAYAGRLIAMKGPVDWLHAVHAAVRQGAKLHATWYGDGPLMSGMGPEIARLGIGENVTLAGNVSRGELMANLRKADIFLFCHKTGESPRCLSEALAAGCALVGYSSAYPRELVANCGGGEFADTGNWQALASLLVALNRDRARFGQLVESAAASGKLLDRDSAIQNRVGLIKKYLTESRLERH